MVLPSFCMVDGEALLLALETSIRCLSLSAISSASHHLAHWPVLLHVFSGGTWDVGEPIWKSRKRRGKEGGSGFQLGSLVPSQHNK